LTFVMKDPELAPDANVAPGNIIRQVPPADSKVPPGAAIELVAAATPTRVPNVVGKTLGEAQLALHAAGLEVGDLTGWVLEQTANTIRVTSQDPANPAVVAKGKKVNLRFPSPCFFPPCRVNTLSTMDRQKALTNQRVLRP